MAVDDHDFVVLSDDDLSDYNAAGILPESRESIRKIQQWLQPTDFAADSSEYKKHLSSYVTGTGNWIQQTETYQAWHDSPKSSSLWIKAIPGAGKSVFAAMAADKLARTEKVPVLYFFFRQIIAKNHDPQYLVRDWLSQLLPYSPSLQSKLKRQMEEGQSRGQSLDDISTDEFWHCLLHAMDSLPKVYCVADALDEMDISKLGFLDRLVGLGQQPKSTVKLLMTSRPLPRIESKLRTPSILQISILQIRLQQNMVDTDIAVYVDHRLRHHKDVRLRDDVREKIRIAICTKGQGSFLYARLMMDKLLDDTTQICSKNSVDLERITTKLPVTLEDMYNGMLLDHGTRSGVSTDLQLTILQWVTHSIRPLRLLELAAMIALLDDSKRKSQDTKALVRTACGPLLEILEDETVSIIHHSFTEFLIDQGRVERASTETGIGQFPVIKSADTHRLLALTCLKYLTSGRLDEWELEPRRGEYWELSSASGTQEGIKMRHPFLDYAASAVCAHVAELESSDEVLFAALDDFMKPDNQVFLSWIDLTWRSSNSIEKSSPLHVAAYWGMANYCQHLIELGQDVNRLDSNSRTPISLASARGHADIVEILLQNGVNADPDDNVGLKPLHYAAQGNHSAVVRLLLASGVDPMTKRTKNYPGYRCRYGPSAIGHTALMYACQGGGVESVLEFMTHLSAKYLNRALRWAAKASRANVVIALLESPSISIDTADKNGGNTPLFYAATAKNPEMIQVLLAKGADPNARSKVLYEERKFGRMVFGRGEENRRATPLHALSGLLAGGGPFANSTLDIKDVEQECCKLLIDAGGDVNAVDDNGRCPIHYSTSPAITSVLLQHGAKATAESKNGSTPLHFACENKADGKLFELLVSHGADINAKRHEDGKTPVHCLLKNSCSYNTSLKDFLAYKPDLDAEDEAGNTPLHLFLQKLSDQEALQALLDAGADPNHTNFNMETPIHTMQYSSADVKIVRVLMSAGANLEARDSRGRTPLLRAVAEVMSNCCYGDGATIVELLELGAKVEARDIHGNSVLHIICEKLPVGSSLRDSEQAIAVLLRILIEAGADPKWINHEGNTLLHEATRVVVAQKNKARSARVQFLELLLELGVPLKQKNYSGATALHIACSTISGFSYADVWKGIIDLLVGPKFCIGIDERDNNGIRAIHLAATLSEQLVGWLVEAGADPGVRTVEGQTPLQVACRARQTNIVGQLLELYLDRNLSHLIDWKDKRGRTALHDASRSGRPETVKLLLDAGADPNMRDQKGLSPLHVCSEFSDSENHFWCSRRISQEIERPGIWKAANVLIGDTQRPIRPSMNTPQMSMWTEIKSEHDTARIRDSVRLLLARGADVVALSQSDCTPLYMALFVGCEVMVDELLHASQQAFDVGRIQPPDGRKAKTGDPFVEQYLRLRTKHSPGILRDLVSKNADSFEWNSLLCLDDEAIFDELIKLQVDFFKQETREQTKDGSIWFVKDRLRQPLPEILVTWGYATLLEKFGPQVSLYHELTCKEDIETTRSYDFQPLLHQACSRELSNMDVVKILVDKLGVDVNARAIPSNRRNGYLDGIGKTALHVLAAGQYWWQKEALKFLLQRGADIEMKDELGQSPLSLSVSSLVSGFWRDAVVGILLAHGANPNSQDNEGLTCLSKASNSEVVRKLVKAGADVTLGDTPPLFTAVASHDVAMVAALLESGAGCKVRRLRDTKSKSSWQYRLVERIPVTEITPLHYAASASHNKKGGRESMLPIVKLLLQKGADPYEVFDGDKTVVHDLLEFGGILQPFLDLPALDLECRDCRGRTLLLAGCCSPFPASCALDVDAKLKEKEPTVASLIYGMGADVTARDSKGMNALHHLLQTETFSNEAYMKTFSLFIKDAPLLVHQKDLEGNTPLHYALRMLRIWSTETLLAAGADPLEPDSGGNTALHHLAKVVSNAGASENPQLAKKFLTVGIPINARNEAGETPLFNYVRFGGDFVREAPLFNYVRFGGDYDYRRWHLSSPISRDDLTTFKEAGADFLARNNDMESLLHIAAKKQPDQNFLTNSEFSKESLVNLFRFLMEFGCDPLAEDINHRTALDVAAACGNKGILKLFQRGEEPKPSRTSVN